MIDPVDIWWQLAEAIVFFWVPEEVLLGLMGL